MSDSDVLFDVKGHLGLITLNRPKALNSLTADMCAAISERLGLWASDPAVRVVAIVGSGEKAFCAGGDVVRVTRSWTEGSAEWRDFFFNEYRMNIAIAEFPKPYVSFVDGITMGGGVGVSMPGDFWVATEKTLFAMPETGLGLFPDVGGGWFLPRMPGETGTYVALTGARLKAPDLYALGLASHVIASTQVAAALDGLADLRTPDHKGVKAVLDGLHADPEPAPIARDMDQIDAHFAEDNVAAILDNLQRDPDDWAQKQYGLLTGKSPTSMKLTLEQLRRGAACDRFRDVMAMEFRMVSRVIAGHDFHEGVRAILIDKDQSPIWEPVTLDRVEPAAIDAHFAPLPAEEELLAGLEDR